NRIHIKAPEAARVLDFANSLYGHMLRCLVQAYGRSDDEVGKRLFVDTAIDLMEVLPSVGSHLASLPANPEHPGVNAGVTFTMLRDTPRSRTGAGEKRVMWDRPHEPPPHARRIFPEGHELAGTCAALDRIAAKFGPALDAASAGATLPAAGTASVATAAKAGAAAAPAGVPTSQPRPQQKPQDVPSGSGMNKVEVAEGKDLRVRFYGKRCIH